MTENFIPQTGDRFRVVELLPAWSDRANHKVGEVYEETCGALRVDRNADWQSKNDWRDGWLQIETNGKVSFARVERVAPVSDQPKRAEVAEGDRLHATGCVLCGNDKEHVRGCYVHSEWVCSPCQLRLKSLDEFDAEITRRKSLATPAAAPEAPPVAVAKPDPLPDPEMTPESSALDLCPCGEVATRPDPHNPDGEDVPLELCGACHWKEERRLTEDRALDRLAATRRKQAQALKELDRPAKARHPAAWPEGAGDDYELRCT